MSYSSDKALLPAGMCDILPPDADFEAETTERLMAFFGSRGYQRVKPPIIEFEDSLLADNGAAMASQSFRLMDPVSRRMLAIRPDMTLQVARIATTRLANAPRPLRLSYAGQVLRVKGSQLRPERQFGQVGAELIGPSTPAADAEVIIMASNALSLIGVPGLSVDLGLPALVPAVIAGHDLDREDEERLQTALERKDAASVASLAGRLGEESAEILSALLAATGPAGRTLEALGALDLKGRAAAERDVLSGVVEGVLAGAGDLKLTVDPVENRGFEYHTGVTFTFFARGVRGELGRGGRYLAGDRADEQATGFTLFMDSVLRALPAPAAQVRVYLPAGTGQDLEVELHEAGWVTIAGLEEGADPEAEALRLGCTHVLAEGEPRELPARKK